MKHFPFFLVAIATMAGLVALIAPDQDTRVGKPPVFATEIQQRVPRLEWISSAHEAGNLNSIGAVLGNDVAVKAYRDGKLPVPDGTIIAALHYRNVPSEENNKILGQAQLLRFRGPYEHSAYRPGLKKYAATGGWGFGHFAYGKLATRHL